MIKMVDIEPFKYQKTNNIDEHNQIVGKVNEIVDAINNANIDGIPGEIAGIEKIANEAKATADEAISKANTNENAINSINTELDTITPRLDTAESKINTLENDNTTNKQAIAENTVNIDALTKELPTDIDVSLDPDKKFGLQYNKEDGTYISSNMLPMPFTKAFTLIPGSTNRSFKIQVENYDGSTTTSNDMIIPEGGGEPGPQFAGITIKAGTDDPTGSFMVVIELDDGSSYESNEYPFPGSIDAYTKTESDERYQPKGDYETVSGAASKYQPIGNYETVEGAASKYETITGAANKYQPKGSYLTSVPIGGDAIGGVKNGGNVVIGSDGTMNASTPAPSGIWEKLDISSLPTDFKEGDILIAKFKILPSLVEFPKDWNSEITVSEPVDMTYTTSCIIPLSSYEIASGISLQNYNLSTCVSLIAIEGLSTADKWNSTDDLFTISSSLFNGQDTVVKITSITKSNISNYIDGLYRLKI